MARRQWWIHRGRGQWGRPPSPLAQFFFSISRLFPYKRHIVCCVYLRKNDDGSDALYSAPFSKILGSTTRKRYKQDHIINVACDRLVEKQTTSQTTIKQVTHSATNGQQNIDIAHVTTYCKNGTRNIFAV